MKKSKFTEGQLTFATKQSEIGTCVEEVSRKMDISEPAKIGPMTKPTLV